MSCSTCGSVYYNGPPADISGRCSSNTSYDIGVTVWLDNARTDNWDLTGYVATGAMSLLSTPTVVLQSLTCQIIQGDDDNGVETTLVYGHVDQADIENLPVNTPIVVNIKAYNASMGFSFTVASGVLTFNPLAGA